MDSQIEPSALPPGSDSGGRTRVLCVDDSPPMTAALCKLIAMQPDLEDAGVLHRAEDLVEEVLRRRVSVVVLDLSMPGEDPLQAIRDLAKRVPTCRVIAFSGHDDAQTRASAITAGAAELVSKVAKPGVLVQTIRRVSAGGARTTTGRW